MRAAIRRPIADFELSLVDASVRDKLQAAIEKHSPDWIGTEAVPYGGADCVGVRAKDLSKHLGGRACEAKCQANHHPARWQCPNQAHVFRYDTKESYIAWELRCSDCKNHIERHRNSVIRNNPELRLIDVQKRKDKNQRNKARVADLPSQELSAQKLLEYIKRKAASMCKSNRGNNVDAEQARHFVARILTLGMCDGTVYGTPMSEKEFKEMVVSLAHSGVMCQYTGIPISFDGDLSVLQGSIDRMHSHLGYTDPKQVCVCVCQASNSFFGDKSQIERVAIIEAIKGNYDFERADAVARVRAGTATHDDLDLFRDLVSELDQEHWERVHQNQKASTKMRNAHALELWEREHSNSHHFKAPYGAPWSLPDFLVDVESIAGCDEVFGLSMADSPYFSGTYDRLSNDLSYGEETCMCTFHELNLAKGYLPGFSSPEALAAAVEEEGVTLREYNVSTCRWFLLALAINYPFRSFEELEY